MAEELAEGFFRVVLALLKAIFRLLIEFLFHVIVEIFGEVLAWIFSPIFRAIGRAIRFVLRPIEALYGAVFQRMELLVKWRPVAHFGAIGILVICAFCAGFAASIAYHAMKDTPTTVALER